MSRRLVIALIPPVIAVLSAALFVAGGLSTATAGAAADAHTGRVWATVSGGYWHTCGIRLDHTLWCWGNNKNGQLGLGDNTRRDVPTQVGTDADWAGLDAGYNNTCATRTDQTLWCWGWNHYGQLGVGDTTDRTTPTQVGTGTEWAQLDAGG